MQDFNGLSLGAILAMGLALGLKHSLETDHLLAVSTLVSRERNVWHSMTMGAIWGLGHATTLLLMGCLVIAMGWHVPEPIALFLESSVAFMLVVLGLKALVLWRQGKGHFCRHNHPSGIEHTHFHRFGQHECGSPCGSPASGHPAPGDPVPGHWASNRSHEAEAGLPERTTGKRQSFLVGMVHGLAGSGALMLVVLTTIPNRLWALLYLFLFGFGLMGGMCLVSALYSWSLALSERRYSGLGDWLHAATGLASLGFGCYLAYGMATEFLSR